MKPTKILLNILFDLTLQCHAVSMALRYLMLGERSELQKLSVFGHRIGLKMKKLEGFFPGEEYRELEIE